MGSAARRDSRVNMSWSPKVAFIDDDAALVELISLGLSDDGFKVSGFSDPLEALESVLVDPYDAVIVDYEMPRMDGISFTQEARKALGKGCPPILMLSGQGRHSTIRRAFAAGIRDYLSKPVSLPLLCVKLQQLLGLQTEEDEDRVIEELPESLGEYEVTHEVGRGGAGIVYGALDLKGDPVAIKAVSPRQDEIDALLRFRREIDLLAQLNHPHVIRIFDTGRTEDTFFFVMELIDGPTLEDLIDDAPLSVLKVTRLLSQVGSGLAHVHAQGLIHRDLKPSNILMCPRRGAILTDFGHSKWTRDQQLTGDDQVVGTPHFMSPEMIFGDPVDHRADLFSLGMVALEALRGKPLITALSSFHVMQAIAEADFPKTGAILKERGLKAPKAFREALDKLVAIDPEARAPSAEALIASLKGLPGAESA